MLKKKYFLFGFIFVFIATCLMSTVSASSFSFRRPLSFGTGSFVHEHEGIPHNHYFAYSVSDGYARQGGWNYNPKGAFYLLATHEGEVHMIVKSDRIHRFMVMDVEGGLGMIMEGVATVNHMGAGWQKGWIFTVEAFDYYGTDEDSIHIMFVAPNGMEHHMEGTLDSGNIVIKK